MFEKLFTVYSTGLTAVTASVGGTGSANISIEANTDFELHFITGLALQPDVIVLTWGGTVQINDSGIKTDFFNVPIRFMEIAGDGRQVYPLKHPRLVTANTVLVVSWVNSVATLTNCCLSLHGYKVSSRNQR